MMNNEKCSDKKQEITKQNSKHNFIQTTVKKKEKRERILRYGIFKELYQG